MRQTNIGCDECKYNYNYQCTKDGICTGPVRYETYVSTTSEPSYIPANTPATWEIDEKGYKETVVLTREECDSKVILDEDHFLRVLDNERAQARKETAKEILNIGKKLYEMAYHKSNAMPRLIEWIKAEYGVEVEE